MDINDNRGFFHSFIRVFTILFIILIILPLILDQIIHYISGGITPGNDSIKVFKDLVAEKAVIIRFLDNLKKIIFLM